MCNMMLCMRNSDVGVGIQDVKMKVIHVVVHVEEKQQNPNNDTDL